MNPEPLVEILSQRMPDLFRWCGAVARQLRRHDVAVADKGAGYAAADALTLADLSIQEILVDALRDSGAAMRQCRLEVEEETGDLDAFPAEAPLTIAIDPIDGTLHFRDRTSDGYGILLSLRDREHSHYSLGFFPEQGACGQWVEVRGDSVIVTDDDTSMPARNLLDTTKPVDTAALTRSDTVWLTGYRTDRAMVGRRLEGEGLHVVGSDTHGAHVCTEMALGRIDGLLMNHPGVYDAPMWMHVLTTLGGNACWVQNGDPIDYRNAWFDTGCKGMRLDGVIACARDTQRLAQIVDVGKRCFVNRDS